MLAMTFLSSILLLTTLVLVQSMNIFNKGATVKQMSQVSRILVEDITRVGNSGVPPTVTWSPSNADRAAACLQIDQSVYIWNLGSGSTDSGYINPQYRYTDGTPINFVKYSGTSCPADRNAVQRNQTTQLVGDQVRVYRLDTAGIAGTSLQKFSLTLGSYAEKDSPYNPFLLDGNYQCGTDGLGSYCASSTIDTVMHFAGKAEP